jgi:hypothetical protein
LRSRFVILTIVISSMYLVAIMGIGRYSCFCSHSSNLVFWGISSKCSCTESDHPCDDPKNCCPCCGRHLISHSVKKNDCCRVSYNFLGIDQSQSSVNLISDIESTLEAIIPVQRIITAKEPTTNLIKNFQALFRSVTDHLYEKHSQLIL